MSCHISIIEQFLEHHMHVLPTLVHLYCLHLSGCNACGIQLWIDLCIPPFKTWVTLHGRRDGGSCFCCIISAAVVIAGNWLGTLISVHTLFDQHKRVVSYSYYNTSKSR
jgi:hypothetical protein